MRLPFFRRRPEITPEQVAEVVRAELSAIMPFNAGNENPLLNVEPAKPGFPYRLDFPQNFALSFGTRRLPGKAFSVDSLRSWARNFDPLRSVIEYLKTEAASIPIGFVAKDGVDSDAVKAQVDFMQAFCADDGPLGMCFTRRVFEAKMHEDALVVGAYGVWYEMSRGGKIISLDAIDAATLKPKVDWRGWPDQDVPFEQWVIGVHVASFRPGELRMDGMHPRTDTPYFDSPVEFAVSLIVKGLKLDEFNLAWLTDGNSQTGNIYSLPGEWTPEQVKDFSDWWRISKQSLVGRQGDAFLPSGSTKLSDHSRKDQDFAEFEIQTIRRLCSLFGVQPASIGYVGEQYKVTQDGSMDASRRVGLGRLLAMRKEFYDDLCRRLGCPGVECKNVEDDLDEFSKEVETGVKACGGPIMLVDEVRARIGLAPLTAAQREELYPTKPEETPGDDPGTGPDDVERVDDDIIGWFRRDGRNVPITEKSAIGRAVKMVPKLHGENGGCSWNMLNGDMGGKPFCVVSVYRERELIIDGETIEPAQVNSFIGKNRDVLFKAGHVMGTWVEDGKSYLDVSVLVGSREEAQELCMLHGQLAYFDLETFETIESGYDRSKEDDD